MTEHRARPAIYESLHELIAQAPAADQAKLRVVEWATGGQRLGFARSPEGAVELFIVGDELVSAHPTLGRQLRYGEWSTVSGQTIGATRLLLPNEPHFDQVAAFICTELQLSGVDQDPAEAFRLSEELIELALADGSIASEALLGLCGEMLLLVSLTRAKPAMARALLMQSWAGYRRSSRDVQLGPVGVEVKTTTTAVSEHHIQGPYQTEIGHSVDGVAETRLYLLSVGLQWLPAGHPGFTLPSLVTELADHLSVADEDEFLRRVRGYAGSARVGYQHGAEALPPEFTRPFTTRFVRLYDLTDPRIRLPRSEELADMDLVPDSVSYRIRLPRQVNGELNPVATLPAATSRILNEANA